MPAMIPYRSVEHALRSAYGQEGRAVIKSPSCFMVGGGSAVSEFWEGLDPWHRVAQGSMTQSKARQALSGTLRAVMEVYYTSPTLVMRKEKWCQTVADAVWEKMGKYPDREYLVDVCRDWAGAGRLRTEKQWEAELGVSAKTLQRWRLGRDVYSSGAADILDRWLGRVRGELAPVFRDAELIP